MGQVGGIAKAMALGGIAWAAFVVFAVPALPQDSEDIPVNVCVTADPERGELDIEVIVRTCYSSSCTRFHTRELGAGIDAETRKIAFRARIAAESLARGGCTRDCNRFTVRGRFEFEAFPTGQYATAINGREAGVFDTASTSWVCLESPAPG